MSTIQTRTRPLAGGRRFGQLLVTLGLYIAPGLLFLLALRGAFLLGGITA